MTRREDRAAGYRKVRSFMERDEWERLCEEVEEHIRGSSEAYVGRTRDPDRRHLAHAKKWRCEDLIVLGRSFQREEVVAVEEGLITAMDRFLRLRNVDTASSGQYVHGCNYIYIALKY